MDAPLSVVIPTLNAGVALVPTAEALLSGVTDGVIGELVVSDGGSTDETLEIARELGAEIVQGAPGRGGQIARGVAKARRDWVLILHADTHLSPEWLRAVLEHIGAHPDKAGYFELGFRARGIWPVLVAAGANKRSRLFDLPYGDQGLLVRRDVLDAVGGVPQVPLMEDVALARSLKGRLRPLEAVAMTSAERYQRDGWAHRIVRNLWTLARYQMGARPEDLVRSYSGASSEN